MIRGAERPARLLQRFGGRRVLVVGEAILDGYLEGDADRLSREAPVPIVELRDRSDAPGGAANTAVNVAALGGSVQLLSVVGDDAEGDRLLVALAECSVATADVMRVPGRTTLAKQRVSAGGQMLLRFDTGSTYPLDPATEDALIERLLEADPRTDAIVVSDYAYGVVTDRVIAVLEELQRTRPGVLVVDARDLRRYSAIRPTAVKPNYGEACRLLGQAELRDPRGRAAQIGMAGQQLLDLTGARICAVTVDADGALIFERDQPAYRTYARPRPNSTAAGAGDTFVAALSLALAADATGPAAAELASAAAAVVVARDGTSVCTAEDLVAALSLASGKRIDDGRDLATWLDERRAAARRIVFTNGVFDILHRGHVTYLARSKALGDMLVVGVNTDGSVRRLKGPQRPINPLDDRLAVLEALSSVDLVIPFEDDTPASLIEQIRPDVYVKGGDYTRETLPEAALVERMGGTVRILPYTEDRSTSGTIDRVREAYGAPTRPMDRSGAVGSSDRPSGPRRRRPARERISR
jgi:D-beta-D-heptose 7-phosphate kinase / D-beta-D-heptose 1-phosphate adenosyltransferase